MMTSISSKSGSTIDELALLAPPASNGSDSAHTRCFDKQMYLETFYEACNTQGRKRAVPKMMTWNKRLACRTSRNLSLISDAFIFCQNPALARLRVVEPKGSLSPSGSQLPDM